MPMLDKDIANCSSAIVEAHNRVKLFQEDLLINGPDSESYINSMMEQNKVLIDTATDEDYFKTEWLNQ